MLFVYAPQNVVIFGIRIAVLLENRHFSRLERSEWPKVPKNWKLRFCGLQGVSSARNQNLRLGLWSEWSWCLELVVGKWFYVSREPLSMQESEPEDWFAIRVTNWPMKKPKNILLFFSNRRLEYKILMLCISYKFAQKSEFCLLLVSY